MICRSLHPELALQCENTKDNHRYCMAFNVEIFAPLHWENPNYEPPKTMAPGQAKQRVSEMAERAQKPPRTNMAAARKAARRGSERAQGRWDDGEKRKIYETVRWLAQNQDELVADDIWKACPEIKPGPGLTAVLRRACSENLIEPGEHASSQRGERDDHDHGRQLRVWRSKVRQRTA